MRKIIKKILPSDSRIFKLLSRLYRSSFKLWLPENRSLTAILDQYASSKEKVTFIQIGSNDGITNDPLHEYVVKNKWQGILVEPVPHLFEKLKKNYASFSNYLMFENSAIAKNDGRNHSTV